MLLQTKYDENIFTVQLGDLYPTPFSHAKRYVYIDIEE